jgi:hypothetical protein
MPDNPLDALLQDHPDLQALRRVADEAERREARTQRVAVHRLDGIEDGMRPLAPPGSAVLFVGRPGSGVMSALRQALDHRDPGLMHEVAERVYGTLVERQPVGLDEAVEQYVRQGVSLDLSYRCTQLVRNVFLPDDLEIAAFPMPYTGGPVDDGSFALTSRVGPGADDWLDAVVVIHEPGLTDIERAALDLIPLEQSGINIGTSAMCYAITAVTVFVVVAGATYACPGIPDVLHLDDETVRRLGPERTSRELLGLRRAALERRNG